MMFKKQTILLITILALIWGSSFILMKRALLVYTPIQVGSLRVFIALICLLPFILKHFATVERSKWKYFIASGFLGNGIPSILFPLAQTKVPSALAGMINSLTPIFTLIVGIFLFGMQVARVRIYGLILGLIGAFFLVLSKGGNLDLSQTNSYTLYIIAATICYAFSVNILRYKLTTHDAIRNTGFALICAGIPMGILAFSSDIISRTVNMPGAPFSLLCIALLGILSTAFSTVLFNKLIKTSGALSAASVTYLIPIVAIMWGIWDQETLTVFHFVWKTRPPDARCVFINI